MSRLLLDVLKTNEWIVQTAPAATENLLESFTFTTDNDNTVVDIRIVVNFGVYRADANNANAAVRVYLDGNGYTAGGGKMWNGYMLINGGQWCTEANTATQGRCDVAMIYTIPTAGTHTIYVQGATSYPGSPTATNTNLRVNGLRRYQVLEL